MEQQKLGADFGLRSSAPPLYGMIKAGRCFGSPPLRGPHHMEQQKLGAASDLRPSAPPPNGTAIAGCCSGSPPLYSPDLIEQQKLGAANPPARSNYSSVTPCLYLQLTTDVI